MEYHLALHLTGALGRDMTLIDLQTLHSYFLKIHVKKFIICIESATRDHLHACFALRDKRPNIKRDIINALGIDKKQYPNNFCYCKKLKLGQTFLMLGGGYLTKGYKHITTHGVSHIDLEEGKNQYLDLKDRKVIRITKHNIVRHYLEEAKNLDITGYDSSVLIHMMRQKKYNFAYIIGKITQNELKFMIHFEVTEPSSRDIGYLDSIFFKEEKNYFS